MAVETTRGIVLNWRAHGWPLRCLRAPVASLHSVAKQLSGLAGGPHMVVVLGLGAHFTTFPPSIFVRRLAGIRAAVAALLAREPRTLVIDPHHPAGFPAFLMAWALERMEEQVYTVAL